MSFFVTDMVQSGTEQQCITYSQPPLQRALPWCHLCLVAH